MKTTAFTTLTLLAASPALADCGSTPGPCKTADGIYELALPQDASAPLAAVVFLHGYGSDGKSTMKNTGMVNAFLARGYAVIAPYGRDSDGKNGHMWSFMPGRPALRDEPAFLRQVMADAAQNHGINRDRILLAGFSIGGSMVSYAACNDPTMAAAYAPVSGSFWRPEPDHCAGPVRLLHTHGFRDTTVPLEGRKLRETDDGVIIAQGDVYKSMGIWRQTNGCASDRPDSFTMGDLFWHRRWTECAPGSALEFVLWPGNHAIPKGWADMALDWFEAQPTGPILPPD